VIDAIIAGQEVAAHVVLLQDLCELMAERSLCALGALTPMPVRSVLADFAEDLDRSVGARP
jgi:formate dehydrogenase iron-sulfur subunit